MYIDVSPTDHDMGLSFHYQLAATGGEARARNLVHAPGDARKVEAAIAKFPNFELLEAEGQRLMPEGLKAALEWLGRFSLL